MVGAVVNAPLTSLAITFSLASYEPSVLIPSAIIVGAAQLTRLFLMRDDGSIFQTLLADSGLRYEAPAPELGISTRRLNRRIAILEAGTGGTTPAADVDYLLSMRRGKIEQCEKVNRATNSFVPCAFALADCAEANNWNTSRDAITVVVSHGQAGTHRVYGILE